MAGKAQRGIDAAMDDGYLSLQNWAEMLIKRIRLNYENQHIWPKGKRFKGPYKEYEEYVNSLPSSSTARPTGESYSKQYLYATVWNNANGNTNAVDFFFKNYLRFVDWGVGRGQPKSKVPDKGVPKWRRRYAKWEALKSYRYSNGILYRRHQRGRRPAVYMTVLGSRFFACHMLELFYAKKAKLSVLEALYDLDRETPEKWFMTEGEDGEKMKMWAIKYKQTSRFRRVK